MSLVGLPIVLPVLAAGACLLLAGRQRIARTIGLLASGGTAAASLALLATVNRDGTQVMEVGSWGAPIGIVLVADLLAVMILVVASLVVFATHLHAVLTPSLEQRWGAFHAVHLVLGAGVALSLLTGDLFTLFVGFEVSLVASYVLLVGPGGRKSLRDASTYIVANLVVSTLFLIAVAGVYAATGTVNMADLAGRWPELDAGVRAALGGALLVVFATKAAAFPFFGWLPDAYRSASVPVAAVLAGLLTKLGVYALVRTETLFGIVPDGMGWLLPALAIATMSVGVVGALAQTDIRRVLAFHIVSQIGYMLFGLALLSESGLAGTVFYVVHHILVKSALFMVAGVIEEQAGSGELSRTGGLGRAAPWLAAAFAVPALSLAGIPPLSGFTAKLALLDAGVSDGAVALVAVGAVVSLLTILSMAKIWAGAFWGDLPARDGRAGVGGALAGVSGGAVTALAAGRRTTGVAVLVTGTLVVSLGAGWVLDMSQAAAADLLNPGGYIGLVLR